MTLIHANNTENAWLQAVSSVFSEGDTRKTEDKDETKEIIGLNVRIKQPSLGDKEIPHHYPFKNRALDDYIEQLMTHKNKWDFEYTYGERIWDWNSKVNQVQCAIDRLSENMSSRRATCDIAIPIKDTVSSDPPCLRIIDFKICELKTAPMLPSVNSLVTTVLFRSHDIFGASYANWIAIANLQKYVASEITKKSGTNVVMGELHSYSVSAHIYDRDFEAAKLVAKELL